jgi:hypothetical protein
MPSPENRFERLAKLSRSAPADGSADTLPPALATRVLAQLRAAAREPVSPWEWLSLRALPLAATVAAICIFFGDGLWPSPAADEQRLAQAIVQQQLTP